MALGPDFGPAEESNTGGFRRLLAPPHFKPTPTSIWAKVRGGRSSHQLLTMEERVRAFTRLWPEPESCSSWLQQVGLVVWPSLVVSSPTSAEPLPPLHYSWAPTGPQRPSPRSALSEGPSPPAPAEEQLCNAVQFFCKIASPRLLWHEKYTLSGTDQSGCQGEEGEGRLGWQE